MNETIEKLIKNLDMSGSKLFWCCAATVLIGANENWMLGIFIGLFLAVCWNEDR